MKKLNDNLTLRQIFQEMIRDVNVFDVDGVIYAELEWEIDSKAAIFMSEDADDFSVTKIEGLDYFLELSLIKDMFDYTFGDSTDIDRISKEIIHYAIHDGYLSDDEG